MKTWNCRCLLVARARRAERADSGEGRAEGRCGDAGRCGDEERGGEGERISGNRAKTPFSESASTDEPNTPESESDIINYGRGVGLREWAEQESV